MQDLSISQAGVRNSALAIERYVDELRENPQELLAGMAREAGGVFDDYRDLVAQTRVLGHLAASNGDTILQNVQQAKRRLLTALDPVGSLKNSYRNVATDRRVGEYDDGERVIAKRFSVQLESLEQEINDLIDRLEGRRPVRERLLELADRGNEFEQKVFQPILELYLEVSGAWLQGDQQTYMKPILDEFSSIVKDRPVVSALRASLAEVQASIEDLVEAWNAGLGETALPAAIDTIRRSYRGKKSWGKVGTIKAALTAVAQSLPENEEDGMQAARSVQAIGGAPEIVAEQQLRESLTKSQVEQIKQHFRDVIDLKNLEI